MHFLSFACLMLAGFAPCISAANHARDERMKDIARKEIKNDKALATACNADQYLFNGDCRNCSEVCSVDLDRDYCWHKCTKVHIELFVLAPKLKEKDDKIARLEERVLVLEQSMNVSREEKRGNRTSQVTGDQPEAKSTQHQPWMIATSVLGFCLFAAIVILLGYMAYNKFSGKKSKPKATGYRATIVKKVKSGSSRSRQSPVFPVPVQTASTTQFNQVPPCNV